MRETVADCIREKGNQSLQQPGSDTLPLYGCRDPHPSQDQDPIFVTQSHGGEELVVAFRYHHPIGVPQASAVPRLLVESQYAVELTPIN